MTWLTDSVIVAFIGTLGAVIGSVAATATSLANQCYSHRLERKANEPRRKLLRQMLEHQSHTWRELETLMHVIGSDEESTKRLLLEIGARASENGKPLWGLISRNPLPTERS